MEADWHSSFTEYMKSCSYTSLSKETGIPVKSLRDIATGRIRNPDRISVLRKYKLYKATGLDIFRIDYIDRWNGQLLVYMAENGLTPQEMSRKAGNVPETSIRDYIGGRTKDLFKIPEERRESLYRVTGLEIFAAESELPRPEHDDSVEVTTELFSALLKNLRQYVDDDVKRAKLRKRVGPRDVGYLTSFLRSVMIGGQEFDMWVQFTNYETQTFNTDYEAIIRKKGKDRHD